MWYTEVSKKEIRCFKSQYLIIKNFSNKKKKTNKQNKT